MSESKALAKKQSTKRLLSKEELQRIAEIANIPQSTRKAFDADVQAAVDGSFAAPDEDDKG